MATETASTAMEAQSFPATHQPSSSPDEDDQSNIEQIIEQQIQEELKKAEEQAQAEVDRKEQGSLDTKQEIEEKKPKSEELKEEAPPATESTSSDGLQESKLEAIKMEQSEQIVSSILDVIIGSACSAPFTSRPTTMGNTEKKPTAVVSPQDKALKEVERIEMTAKQMFEDPGKTKGPAKKRLSEDTSRCAKRLKTGSEDGEKEGSKAKSAIKRLTRQELEDFVCNAMAEVISARSEVAQLRRKCDTYEGAVERFRRKAVALRKQNSDLTAVVKRYIVDSKEGEARNRAAVPMKITRSVGLTVNMVNTSVVAERRVVANSATPRTTVTPLSQSVANTPVRGISQKSPPKRTSTNIVVSPQQANFTGSPYTSRRPLQQTPTSLPATAVPVPTASITRVIRPVATAPAQSQSVANGSKAPEVVDITDEDDKRQQRRVLVTTTGSNGVSLPPNTTYRVVTAPQVRNGVATSNSTGTGRIIVRAPNNLPQSHPAPLPPPPQRAHQSDPPSWKLPPPKPFLKISKLKNGIVLSWNIMQSMVPHASLSTFQIYAYQENPSNANHPISSNLWKKVGDVKALPLPMACTLTQFQAGHKYHFAVRAQDTHNRIGSFSDAQTISLT